jgi:hypothetical protein
MTMQGHEEDIVLCLMPVRMWFLRTFFQAPHNDCPRGQIHAEYPSQNNRHQDEDKERKRAGDVLCVLPVLLSGK